MSRQLSMIVAALFTLVPDAVAFAQSVPAAPASGQLTVTATIEGSISLLVEPAEDLGLVSASVDGPAVRIRIVRANGGPGIGTRQGTLPSSIDTRVAPGRAKTATFASSVLGYSQATFYFRGRATMPTLQLATATVPVVAGVALSGRPFD
jgi:hypothetical protein